MFFGLFDRLARKRPSRAELDALSADLAIPREDLVAVADARPAVRHEIEQMARRFGLEPAAIDRDRWRALEIVRTCSACERARDCAAFLDDRPGTFDKSQCPNAHHYRDLLKKSQ